MTIATVPGDLNGDDLIDLSDLVLALQIQTGFHIDLPAAHGDVNNDGVIGMAEILYILNRLTL